MGKYFELLHLVIVSKIILKLALGQGSSKNHQSLTNYWPH